MSKPTLYWTLRPHWYSGGYVIMRVTTEKPRRLWGTCPDGEPLQAKPDQCVGRFASREEAQARIDAAERAAAAHADNIVLLTAARNRAERLQREAIQRAVNGEDRREAVPIPHHIINECVAAGVERCRKAIQYGNG